MPRFAYTARTSAGELVRGRVEAATEQAVVGDLLGRGLNPVSIGNAASAPAEGARIPVRALARAYRQLGDLLHAGVPLLRALRLLSRGKSNAKLAAAIGTVADAVEDGERLADALSRFPRTFPEVQVAMVRAGERAGFLDEVLGRLAGFLERQADMRSKVIGNLIYPVILLVVGLGIVIAALVFFVPKFEQFFEERELPMATELLLGTSKLLVSWWWALLVVLGGLGFGAWWLRRQEAVRRWVTVQRLRIPVVGALERAIASARFSRVLGTMLANGIPLIQAMQISRDAAGNVLLVEAIDAATEAVRGGDPLAGPLEASGFFEEDVVEMIAVGESANNLATVLVGIADTLESRVDRQLTIAVRLMEPALLLMLAMVVLFIFLALVFPMMQLSSSL